MGSDGKLHFVNASGADSVLNFSGASQIDFLWAVENKALNNQTATLKSDRKFSDYKYIYITFGELGDDYRHLDTTPTFLPLNNFINNVATISITPSQYFVSYTYTSDTTFRVSCDCSSYRHSYVYGIK